MISDDRDRLWPALPYDAWAGTCQTLHLWMQIVGKVRMALASPANHWWHVTLYVDARGLTTRTMPCGDRMLEIKFDFISHRLILVCSDGASRNLALEPKSVARFYAEVLQALEDLGVQVKILPRPSELPDAIPFAKDEIHASYDPVYAARFWRVLSSAEQVFQQFRWRFLGKQSPVHHFWGANDMAATRFSGRKAPLHPPNPMLPDAVVREAYSHEVASAGFWPGDTSHRRPTFYAYAYPEPSGYGHAAVRPTAAGYDAGLGEFLLDYDAVRTADDPAGELMSFLQSTYDAAADLGGWDRAALERQA
jgi:hypothetical protein